MGTIIKKRKSAIGGNPHLYRDDLLIVIMDRSVFGVVLRRPKHGMRKNRIKNRWAR
jgi:hypothetical protein